jgi:hypothetical protein
MVISECEQQPPASILIQPGITANLLPVNYALKNRYCQPLVIEQVEFKSQSSWPKLLVITQNC